MTRIAVPLLILLALLAAGPARAQAGSRPAGEAVLVLPDTAKWSTCGGWESGCEALVVYGDPAAGPSHLLVRLAPSATIPLIRHASNEHFVVVQGRFVTHGRDGREVVLGPGAHWYVPEGMVHGDLRCADRAPCTFYESHDKPLVTTPAEAGSGARAWP